MLDKRSCLREEAATVWTPRDAIKIHLEVESLKIERRCLVFSVGVLCRWRKFRVTGRSYDLATYQRNSNGSHRRSVSLDTRLVGYATVSDSLFSDPPTVDKPPFPNNNYLFARVNPSAQRMHVRRRCADRCFVAMTFEHLFVVLLSSVLI